MGLERSPGRQSSARLSLVPIKLTFGCGIIISNEVFSYVVGASEVLEGHGAGGGRVGEVGARAGLPQGGGRGRRAIQDFQVFMDAVEAGEGNVDGCLCSEPSAAYYEADPSFHGRKGAGEGLKACRSCR